MGTKGAWTPERRAKQAETIRRTKPWEHSTGPRTEAGKQTSSRNAVSMYVKRRRAVLAVGKNFRAMFALHGEILGSRLGESLLNPKLSVNMRNATEDQQDRYVDLLWDGQELMAAALSLFPCDPCADQCLEANGTDTTSDP